MRDFNVNREPISSEEISTFKDFKSILRKHAQTTEDLSKIKNVGGSSRLYWGLGGALSAIAIISVMLLSNTDEEVSDSSTNSVLIVNEVKFEKEGMEVHKKILGNQIGYFYTEIGPLNEIVHLYGYDSLDDRAKRRKELAENKIWQKYIAKAIDLFESQESKILIPANFSNIK